MATSAVQPLQRRQTETLLEWLLRNGRGEKLCAEISTATGASHTLVEDVFQEVCLEVSRGEGSRGQSVGEVYNWMRTATQWRVLTQLRIGAQRFEQPVGWTAAPSEREGLSVGADVEAISRERRRELGELVRVAFEGLDERQRKVAVLHAYGVKGPEIARRLGLSRRQVLRLKEQMLARARGALAAHAGSGCEHGDELVRRLAFGLASAREHTDAELHMAGCESCASMYRRLQLWHESVAALAPMPAAGAADPGLVERVVHTAVDAVGQARQQVVDAGGQAKQHVAAGYARAVDYTPIAGARPGAAATVIAGCLALGGGAATYCVDRGVDPFTGLVNVIQPAPTASPNERAEQPPGAEPPPTTPEFTATSPVPPPSSTSPAAPVEQQPAVQPAPAHEPPPAPPPEPTPPAVQFGEPATPPATSSPSTTSTPTAAAAPATPEPVRESGGGSDLYGP